MSKNEALIDLLTRAAEYCLPSNTEKSHIEMLADFLYDYVEVVRIRVPKGEKQAAWVYDHWCEFKCSVCGEFSNSKPYKGKEKYCPNCGAKMKAVK